MRNTLTVLTLLLLLACSRGEAQQPAPASTPPAPLPGAQDVAARIGDRNVTVAELDERWRASDPVQQAQATQALYDGRKAALDDLIASMVIEEAAKAAGTTPAQYVDGEIARRLTPVSDTDVAVFYGENRGQMQGRSLQEMSPLIRRFLEDRARESARAALVAELRAKGPDVRILFEPPRVEVAVAPDDPSIGPANAPVTLVEFSDFQCPFCQRVAPTLKELRDRYGDRLRIVWKDFPLTQIHPQAFDAAQAGLCARDQGKFWEYHDLLFANQAALQRDALKQYAGDSGMDAAAFSACLDSNKYQARVQASLDAGGRLGIGSTPTSYINGRAVTGAQPLEVFTAIIDEELQRAAR
ncbi:MAG: thioredoxin domain-containing protein [Vicinamibacterales bacterium]